MVTLESVTTLAGMVRQWAETHGENPPPLPSYDAVAAVLGVGAVCTGDPKTAAASVEHTPKTGLSVRFYRVTPGYRGDSFLGLAYFVATWRGEEYRGEVAISTGGYHSNTANGFVCFDLSRYVAQLPDGCRTKIAEIVTAAVLAAGSPLAGMATEQAAYFRHYEIANAVSKAARELDTAARIERGQA